MTIWGIGHATASIASIVFLLFVSWLVGISILRLLGLVLSKPAPSASLLPEEPASRLLDMHLLACGAGLGVLILLVIVFAASYLLSPLMLWGSLIVLVLATYREWRVVSYVLSQVYCGIVDKLPHLSRMDQFLLGLLLLESVSILLLDLTPVTGWDAAVYHLTVPLRFLESGGWTNLPTIAHSYLYMNVDMLFLWALGLHGEQAAHLMAGALSFLTCLSVFAIARHVLHRRYALLATCMFLFVPLVWEGSTDLFIDLGMVFFLLMSLLAVCLPKNKGVHAPLFMAAFFAGLAVGSKLTAVIFLPVIFWCAYLRLRRHGVPCLSFFAILGVVFLLPACIWACRSFLLTGNPIYPIANVLFGLPASPQFGQGLSAYTTLSLPWRVILAPWQLAAGYYSSATVWEGGWGPFVLAFTPLAFFFGMQSWLRVWMWPLLVSFLLYLVFNPYPRYGLFLLATGSIYAAYALQGCHRKFPDLFRVFMIAIVLSAALFCALFLSKALQRSAVALGSQTVEEYLFQRDSIYPVADWVNENRVVGGVVLLIGERSLRFDSPIHVVMEFSPFFEEVFVQRDPVAFNEHLERMGITDIVVSKSYLVNNLSGVHPMLSSFLEEYAFEYHEQDGYVVYRLVNHLPAN